ncbi:hypothetical protein E2C01_066179 [Portunus trituberculatus]|uniref:Uncharacterized protein n=1 Tax=Portunus trituberculatus TaxID=210409 RepID=A0A5B7HQ96_PORTR|nr:hypothetical protein [Portunus trituberculatus]
MPSPPVITNRQHMPQYVITITLMPLITRDSQHDHITTPHHSHATSPYMRQEEGRSKRGM